jgi:hypothetical protein
LCLRGLYHDHYHVLEHLPLSQSEELLRFLRRVHVPYHERRYHHDSLVQFDLLAWSALEELL